MFFYPLVDAILSKNITQSVEKTISSILSNSYMILLIIFIVLVYYLIRYFINLYLVYGISDSVYYYLYFIKYAGILNIFSHSIVYMDFISKNNQKQLVRYFKHKSDYGYFAPPHLYDENIVEYETNRNDSGIMIHKSDDADIVMLVLKQMNTKMKRLQTEVLV